MKMIIVQLGKIGDAILTMPLLNKIKTIYPDSEIDFLSGTYASEFIKYQKSIDNIFIYKKRPLEIIRLISALRKSRYSILIDPKDHPSGESAIFSRIIRAEKKIGFNPPGKNYFTDGLPGDKENADLHFTQKVLRPLEILGISLPGLPPKPYIDESPASVHKAADFFSSFGEEMRVIVNISASRPNRMWSLEKWTGFFNNTSYGGRFILSFAPSESDLARKIAASCPNVILYNSSGFMDVVSLVKKSSLVITPDTSIVHVSSAFDKPIIGLFPSVNKSYPKFHPLSSMQEVLKSGEGSDNIDTIPTAVLEDALMKILNKLHI